MPPCICNLSGLNFLKGIKTTSIIRPPYRNLAAIKVKTPIKSRRGLVRAKDEPQSATEKSKSNSPTNDFIVASH